MCEQATDDDGLEKIGIFPDELLGEGSYSHVKSAIWKKGDDSLKVAIKIINRGTAPVEFKKKFLPRELRILKALKHPNIIQMYDSFNIKNKTYICLEHAGHGDLLGFVQTRGPLRNDETKNFFEALCSGIEYMHARGIVHRDLKCENILLSNCNQIKIADFGFAREIDKSELSKTFCGSAAYAAPEVIKGVAYQGEKADTWSLGVILFVMACCMMPFRDQSRAVLMKDQQMPLRFPSNLAAKLDKSFMNLASGILNHVVEKRFSLAEISNHEWVRNPIKPSTPLKIEEQSSVDSGFESVASSYTAKSV